MSRRPLGATNAELCASSKISRRQLIAGSAAVAIMPDIPANRDPAVGVCQVWFELEARQRALIERWQELETRLIRRGYWSDRSHKVCAEMPEARELDAIDILLNALDKERQELFRALPGVSATTAQGIKLKLDIFASAMCLDENGVAFELVASIQRDLKVIKC
ncbi:hypothetical protein [Hyphomonas sp.]|uniref:hypothetical protein n=1 Tax=Hyphomonas sp. TaxID=87 RepID=UPI0032423668